MLVLDKIKPQLVPVDGWYVFQDFALRGPLSAQDALKVVENNPNQRNMMIRHQGFSRWYSMSNLLSICYGSEPPLHLNAQALHLAITSMVEQLMHLRRHVQDASLQPLRRISDESLRHLKNRLFVLEQKLNPDSPQFSRALSGEAKPEPLLLDNLRGMEIQYAYEPTYIPPPGKWWEASLAIFTLGLSCGNWLR